LRRTEDQEKHGLERRELWRILATARNEAVPIPVVVFLRPALAWISATATGKEEWTPHCSIDSLLQVHDRIYLSGRPGTLQDE
jgi:hypothetical protein